MGRPQAVPRLLVAGVLAATLVGSGVAIAAATSHPKEVTVCATKKGLVRAASAHNKCPRHTRKVKLGTTGPKGATGATGPRGAEGPAAPSTAYRKLVPRGQTYNLPGTPFRVECRQTGNAIHVTSPEFAEYAATYTIDGGAATSWYLVEDENGSGGAATSGPGLASTAFSMHAVVPSGLAADVPVTSVSLDVLYYNGDPDCQVNALVTTTS